MRHLMRDDVLGLSRFRTLPTTGTDRAPAAPQRALAPQAPTTSNFASALNRATQARAQVRQPYASPLKQSAAGQAAASRRPTTTHPTPRTPSTPASAGRASTAQKPAAPPAAHKPAAAAAPSRPQPPADQAATASLPWSLGSYPHPNGDNGRGLHWVPTTRQSPAAIDRFVAEAQRMGIKWVTFLNNGANVGDNDYLVSKLVGAGIEPVMRIWTPSLQPIQGDIKAMVQHYTAQGVHYFQPFNEPNLNAENPDGKVSVDRYLDTWIPTAKAIIAGGGLPGFGSMAPGGDYDDQQFLKDALAGLKARGEIGLLNRGWISMHNYTWNHPIQDRGDGDGFFKFRAYHGMVNEALGRDLPIIGTEGGTFIGEQEDPKMPAVTAQMAADWTRQADQYMRDQREPWNFANSVWTIANAAAGGSDPRFEAEALFRSDGTINPIVDALRGLG